MTLLFRVTFAALWFVAGFLVRDSIPASNAAVVKAEKRPKPDWIELSKKVADEVRTER